MGRSVYCVHHHFLFFLKARRNRHSEATLFHCSRQLAKLAKLAKLGGEPTTARPLDVYFGAPSRAANSRAGGSPRL
jgi:hypothetical protein